MLRQLFLLAGKPTALSCELPRDEKMPDRKEHFKPAIRFESKV